MGIYIKYRYTDIMDACKHTHTHAPDQNDVNDKYCLVKSQPRDLFREKL